MKVKVKEQISQKDEFQVVYISFNVCSKSLFEYVISGIVYFCCSHTRAHTNTGVHEMLSLSHLRTHNEANKYIQYIIRTHLLTPTYNIPKTNSNRLDAAK